jgi:hypothetical protein
MCSCITRGNWCCGCTLWTSSLGVPLPLLLYPRGRCYKKGNQVSYNMIPIRTLSLLSYFIDIAIYALGSTPWSSGIFWMMDRVVLDPSLGLLSLCRAVPRIPILVSSPWVLGKWVDAAWSRSSLSVMNLLSTQSRNSVLWYEIAECFFIELIE